MSSGSRTGVELLSAWDTLRNEAIQSSEYLDRDMGGPLKASAEGAGDGRVNGSTRRMATTWLGGGNLIRRSRIFWTQGDEGGI